MGLDMTQNEKWMKNYHEVMEYMESNKRNPSKYDLEVRHLYTWVKHQRKVMNAGKLQGERLDLFNELLDLAEEFRRVNQWV